MAGGGLQARFSIYIGGYYETKGYMIMLRQLRYFLLSWAILLVAIPAAAQQKAPLVLAAASLQEALTEAATAYAAQGHSKPIISFAASSALARQIESGAPADMFISADEEWMNYLAARALIRRETRSSFLTNRLVLVTPATRPLRIWMRAGLPLAKALGSGRLAMADPAAVPAGKYGKAALTALGVWRDVEPKVVAAENVRAALLLVNRGEARAGIVYETDARVAKGIAVAGIFPRNTHPRISYPMALLSRSDNPEAARFRAFLLSKAGTAILRRYGFGTH